MTAGFRIAMAPRRSDPRCEFCGGTGVLRLPTTSVYDVEVECDCVGRDPELVERERLETWAVVLGP